LVGFSVSESAPNADSNRFVTGGGGAGASGGHAILIGIASLAFAAATILLLKAGNKKNLSECSGFYYFHAYVCKIVLTVLLHYRPVCMCVSQQLN